MKPSDAANARTWPAMRWNAPGSKPARSILFTATARRRIPSSEAMVACRRVCGSTPSRASTRMIAASAVDAPVAMFRVYCAWPGVSARMNFRRLVSK